MKLISELKNNPKIILSQDGVCIRVLSEKSEKSIFSQDVANITVWRNYYPEAYLTRFFSTWDRTHDWLAGNYMRSGTDLMLMFVDKHGVCFGHIAFINFMATDGITSCELSRVVRGPGLGSSKDMKLAFDLAMEWCAKFFNLNEIKLEVFEDNISAIALYKSFGFKKTGLKNLCKVGNSNEYHWQICDFENTERTLLLMKKVF